MFDFSVTRRLRASYNLLEFWLRPEAFLTRVAHYRNQL